MTAHYSYDCMQNRKYDEERDCLLSDRRVGGGCGRVLCHVDALSVGRAHQLIDSAGEDEKTLRHDTIPVLHRGTTQMDNDMTMTI